MTVITRRLPNTNITRYIALNKAKGKLDNPGPVGVVITDATKTRLNSMQPLYNAAYVLVQQRNAEMQAVTTPKNQALQPLRLLCKHFIGVFNFGVERGKYTADQRPYFGIPANNSNLPDLSTQDQVVILAQAITNGDPLRVTAGGAAMANPSTAEVAAAGTTLYPLLLNESNAQDALDLAQEALDTLNTEADKVIKKVWDEAEAFFNEEDTASQRESARKWGVVYVTRGAPAVLTGLIKNGSGAGRVGAVATIAPGSATATANEEGRYTLNTNLLGDVVIEATFPGTAPVQVTVNIPDHEEGITIEVPDIIIP